MVWGDGGRVRSVRLRVSVREAGGDGLDELAATSAGARRPELPRPVTPTVTVARSPLGCCTSLVVEVVVLLEITLLGYGTSYFKL
jgi:hypothetical protein